MNKVSAEVLELIHWVLELIICSIWSSEWDELSRIQSGKFFSFCCPPGHSVSSLFPSPKRHLRQIPHSFSPFEALKAQIHFRQ